MRPHEPVRRIGVPPASAREPWHPIYKFGVDTDVLTWHNLNGRVFGRVYRKPASEGSSILFSSIELVFVSSPSDSDITYVSRLLAKNDGRLWVEIRNAKGRMALHKVPLVNRLTAPTARDIEMAIRGQMSGTYPIHFLYDHRGDMLHDSRDRQFKVA